MRGDNDDEFKNIQETPRQDKFATIMDAYIITEENILSKEKRKNFVSITKAVICLGLAIYLNFWVVAPPADHYYNCHNWSLFNNCFFGGYTDGYAEWD